MRKKREPRFKKPNFLYYHFLYFVMGVIVFFKGARIKFKNRIKGKKAPFIVLANHGSFWDFYYVARAVYPRRVTVIMNAYFEKSPFISTLLKPLHTISKKLFTTDIQTIKSTMLAAKSGNLIVMMPEGRLSTSGEGFDIADGTEKLIKKLNLDVVTVNIKGAYKVSSKWSKYSRKGRVDIENQLLITKEELASMSGDEVRKVISENLVYNDFEHKGKYKCKDFTKGLEGILYYCPQCGSLGELEFGNHKGHCKKCSYEMQMDNEYVIHSNIEGPTNIVEWYRLQDQYLEKKIYDENLVLEIPVRVEIPKEKGTGMYPIGEGIARLSKEAFTYEGTYHGEVSSFSIPLNCLKALPFSCNEEFELYHNDLLHFFYPLKEQWKCVMFSQYVDIVNKKLGENYGR